eukprot:TRINITY_DN86992_c0_g1_i1.p1 TRINITY_DN86992_c0_g1~~TRINITY_DN86992_c0_g1_i1.p1  ORF type:complete len:169 (+),score=32.65 TRINITY_DN86992_c0_g1_i1:61-507(+)
MAHSKLSAQQSLKRRVLRALAAAVLALALCTFSAAAFAAAGPGLHGGARAPEERLASKSELVGTAFPVERQRARLAASALGMSMSLPKTCNDDFECNGGSANFPLRCLDLAFTKICVDPDDFGQSSQESFTDLAYVPLPVRSEDSEPR